MFSIQGAARVERQRGSRFELERMRVRLSAETMAGDLGLYVCRAPLHVQQLYCFISMVGIISPERITFGVCGFDALTLAAA